MENERDIEAPVKIGRISYINVAPVYYGLDRNLKPDWIEMVTEPPAVLNEKLARGEIVMSPVSSAAYAINSDQWLLIPGLSISSFGKVMSVILVSKYSMDKLDGRRVVLSEESASAASLVRLIFKKNNIKPEIVTGKISRPSDIRADTDAALIIGDAALMEPWGQSFGFVFDLGEMWCEMTGLPFVFAVWAIRKDFVSRFPVASKNIAELFNKSKQSGDMSTVEIIRAASLKTGLCLELCEKYFEILDCSFGEAHIQGLETFFKELYLHKIINKQVTLKFA